MTISHDKVMREMLESDFARLFNQENENWHGNSMYNKMFIVVQQNWLNDVLAARGHAFLNELYDVLGFPRIPQGQLIGWYYSESPIINLRLTQNDDGSVMIEPNLTHSDVMYFKI